MNGIEKVGWPMPNTSKIIFQSAGQTSKCQSSICGANTSRARLH